MLRVSALPLALFGLGPFFLEPVLHYNSMILSEPYLLLCWSAILAGHARLPRISAGRSLWGAALLLGCLLAAATLFRVQGGILTAAVLAALALERRGFIVWTLCAATALAPVGVWFLIHRSMLARGPTSNHPDEFPYVDWVLTQSGGSPLLVALRSVGENSAEYRKILSGYVSPSSWVGAALVIAAALAAVAGMWKAGRRDIGFTGTLLGMTGIVLAWPFAQDRLVLSILPVGGLAAAVGVDALLERFGGHGRRIVAVALGGLALWVAVRQVEIAIDARGSAVAGQIPTKHSASFGALVNSRYIAVVSDWLTRNAGATDRVLVDSPTGVYLHTGLPAVGSTVAGNDMIRHAFGVPGAFLARRILEDGVTIVVLGNLNLPIARDIATVMERCPGVLTYVGGVAGQPLPAFYRVKPDERCLRERILAP